MFARHFSSVLLPLPLLPTTPKNSPSATSKLTSRSAVRGAYERGLNGCSTRSRTVVYFSWGSRNVLLTDRADTATAAVRRASAGRSESRTSDVVGLSVTSSSTLSSAGDDGRTIRRRCAAGRPRTRTLRDRAGAGRQAAGGPASRAAAPV